MSNPIFLAGNDGSFSIPSFSGLETQAILQVDFGVGFWGNHFALAYDADGDGEVRKLDLSEVGPGLKIGSRFSVGVQVVAADGTVAMAPIEDVDGSGGDWVRSRLVMDLTANSGQGSGDLYYQNLSNGDVSFQPVAGLQGINLGLDSGASDARNPALWDGMWLHMEGATNQLDNVVLSNDSDEDGVSDANDLCPETVIPEGVPSVRLNINRWALVDADLDFDTTQPAGKGPNRSYSTSDTGGCSCEQIIEAQGLG
jgi:hypothetical protein